MLSISSVMITCGGVFASLMFGYLAEYYGISMSRTITGVLLIVSSALYVLNPEKQELRAT